MPENDPKGAPTPDAAADDYEKIIRDKDSIRAAMRDTFLALDPMFDLELNPVSAGAIFLSAKRHEIAGIAEATTEAAVQRMVAVAAAAIMYLPDSVIPERVARAREIVGSLRLPHRVLHSIYKAFVTKHSVERQADIDEREAQGNG